ncbi:hypothetical protein M427DRAFT_35082 [Gonapodya prolifera JEL478]|uniref:Dystroglycan-type cadherin-like domain-containing protein n=1 Tax=Gonapodya prolifera (strain JEL478) TaxID=1344416 RepID=A0A139A5T0_GONPJ|nr:hypothetical protein M427DRAFT_35082 [Gonapodya prolifera JEL478]|eukprot:KXS12009.1 hypothetical protein M427DRAFT_35082 [Gonapodya prolifera JEL478]
MRTFFGAQTRALIAATFLACAAFSLAAPLADTITPRYAFTSIPFTFALPSQLLDYYAIAPALLTPRALDAARPLPAWLTWNASTATLSGIPAVTDASLRVFFFGPPVAANAPLGLQRIQISFLILVNNNYPPEVILPDTSPDFDVGIRVPTTPTPPCGDPFVLTMGWWVRDQEAAQLVYAATIESFPTTTTTTNITSTTNTTRTNTTTTTPASPGPVWLRLNDTSQGTLTGTPPLELCSTSLDRDHLRQRVVVSVTDPAGSQAVFWMVIGVGPEIPKPTTTTTATTTTTMAIATGEADPNDPNHPPSFTTPHPGPSSSPSPSPAPDTPSTLASPASPALYSTAILALLLLLAALVTAVVLFLRRRRNMLMRLRRGAQGESGEGDPGMGMASYASDSTLAGGAAHHGRKHSNHHHHAARRATSASEYADTVYAPPLPIPASATAAGAYRRSATAPAGVMGGGASVGRGPEMGMRAGAVRQDPDADPDAHLIAGLSHMSTPAAPAAAAVHTSRSPRPALRSVLATGRAPLPPTPSPSVSPESSSSRPSPSPVRASPPALSVPAPAPQDGTHSESTLTNSSPLSAQSDRDAHMDTSGVEADSAEGELDSAEGEEGEGSVESTSHPTHFVARAGDAFYSSISLPPPPSPSSSLSPSNPTASPPTATSYTYLGRGIPGWLTATPTPDGCTIILWGVPQGGDVGVSKVEVVRCHEVAGERVGEVVGRVVVQVVGEGEEVEGDGVEEL